MLLLVSVIPLAFIVVWLFLQTFVDDLNWKNGFVLSFVFTNGYLIILTEFLSLLKVLTGWGIFMGWLLLMTLLKKPAL